MRYLLISVITILIVSCTAYPKRNGYTSVSPSEKAVINPYFSDANKDYVYKANIDVYGRSFGGLFIVKKISALNHRVVFTTEMGNTIFDFSFFNDEFKVNYIIEDLNKKILLNILEKDFRVLIREHIAVIEKTIKDTASLFESEIVSNTYFYHFDKNKVLNEIVRVNNGKTKVHFKFSGIDTVSAKNIQILHNNIKLKINLKSIN